MVAHRLSADVETFRDLRVGKAVAEQFQDFCLPFRQCLFPFRPNSDWCTESTKKRGRLVDVAGGVELLEELECLLRFGHGNFRMVRADGPGELELRPRKLQRHLGVPEGEQCLLEARADVVCAKRRAHLSASKRCERARIGGSTPLSKRRQTFGSRARILDCRVAQ